MRFSQQTSSFPPRRSGGTSLKRVLEPIEPIPPVDYETNWQQTQAAWTLLANRGECGVTLNWDGPGPAGGRGDGAVDARGRRDLAANSAFGHPTTGVIPHRHSRLAVRMSELLARSALGSSRGRGSFLTGLASWIRGAVSDGRSRHLQSVAQNAGAALTPDERNPPARR